MKEDENVTVCMSVNLALALAFDGLLVGLDVEVDEEEEVASEETAPEGSSTLCTGACTWRRELTPEVGGREVGITCKKRRG